MNYYVDIIDTQNSDYTTILEDAAKSSIVLSYKGSDAKDELSIVGSTLKFVIKVSREDNVDGAFEHLFTGDETRYKIELRKEVDNVLLWQGFTLPDSYSEPYKNGTLDIDITATDGLGRLKGKYLPDAYYKDEHKVTDIIAECLKLTGLEMPFYFCPAIENFHQPNFHTIYLQGKDFLSSSDKKDDAYKILNYLAEDLLFCVFQSMGYWHLEGLNKRNQLVYTAKEYDADGAFIGEVSLTRNIKVINNHTRTTPTVTTVVPYGLIEIDYDREPLTLEDVAQEVNTGWVVTSTVNPEIYSSKWIGSYFVKAASPEYFAMFKNSESGVFDATKKVSLRNKLYVQREQKFNLKMSFEIKDMIFNQNNNIVSTWTDTILYEIKINDTVLFSNFGDNILDTEVLNFENKVASVEFEFIAAENGMLDIVLYEPFDLGNYVSVVLLTNLNLKMVGFETLETFREVANLDFTQVLSKQLTFSDDATGYGKSFLLQPLFENSSSFEEITIPIQYSFTQNGKFYSAVALDGAKLINEERLSVTHSTNNSVEILDVVFNYQGLESMLIETNVAALTGSFIFKFYYKIVPTTNRDNWYEWADSLYGLERFRFTDMHAKIYRRLFRVPHVKADLSVKMPFLFTDIVQWQYKEASNYTISNLRSWNLDSGVTQLTINKAVYQNEDVDTGGDNLPPFVSAGPTIYISDSATQATLVSTSGDPDGFITNWQWQQVTSVPGVVFATPNNTSTGIENLTEDFYTFQITVTDNDGATAFSQVDVIRLIDFLIELTQTQAVSQSFGDGYNETTENFYLVACTPPLLEGFVLSMQGNYTMVLSRSDVNFDVSWAQIEIIKNGSAILDETVELFGNVDFYEVEVPVSFSYISTDVIEIKLTAQAEYTLETSAQARVDFNLQTITFAAGQGQITSVLPINRQATAS